MYSFEQLSLRILERHVQGLDKGDESFEFSSRGGS
jgi:hypothetical protein